MNGVIADISGMTKPQTIIPIIKRIRQYIKHMEYAKRPVTHVEMYADDFDSAMRSLNKSAKERSLPPVVGLRFEEIPVTRSDRK